jgi:hypothetical protein
METQREACLNCGKEIIGRAGKKYCDIACKNAYANAHKSEEEMEVIRINKILRRNWRILKTLSPKGKTTIRKEFLLEKGYEFNYFTNVFLTDRKKVYYFCYSMGFTAVDKIHVCIVNWQPYMSNYNHPVGLFR